MILKYSQYLVAWLFLMRDQLECQLVVEPPDSEIVRSLRDSIVWTCQLEGIDLVGVTVNIQWFNPTGVEILDKTAGRDGTPYVDKSVPETSQLYIESITEDLAGNYTCYTLLDGNPQSVTVGLVVKKDITFDNAPGEQYPKIYTDALILCQVSGQPIPDVFWRYSGSRLTGDRYTQDAYGLRIKNISQADNGLYYCCAQIQLTGDYKETVINVIVHIPPNITSYTNPQTGIASQQFVLICQASALPDAKFDFYKDQNLQPSFSTDRIQVDNNGGEITFRPLIAEDKGVYNCTAYNDVGQDTRLAQLNVIVPPTVYAVRNVTQTEGLTTTLVCLSYGDPPPDMTYRKAGALQDYVMGSNEGGRIVLSSPGPGELDMTISNLQWDDTANYTCKSQNAGGYHEKNGTVIVYYVPRFSSDMPTVVYNWAGKTRNLTCIISAQPKPVIRWIRMGFILTTNETYRIYIMDTNSNLQVTVRQVDEYYIYGNYTCQASNQIGTNSISIEMRRALLPGPPQSASVIRATPTSLDLSISPPLDTGGVPLLGFWVQHENFIQEFQLTDDFLIDYLRPSNNYVLLIRARTEVGIGDILSINARTLDISVPYPILINSDPVGEFPYIYTVTWVRPETGGLSIKEYEFRIRQVAVKPGTHELDHALEDWSRRIKNDDPSSPMMYYMIQGLIPMTFYQLEIRAMNDIGWSLPNPEFIFSTGYDPAYSTDNHGNSLVFPLLNCVLLLTVSVYFSRL